MQPNGTIQLDVTSTNPTESPLRTSQNRTELGMSDVITVRLIKGNFISILYVICSIVTPLKFVNKVQDFL